MNGKPVFLDSNLTIGMDGLGRMLLVVHMPRDERTRIVTARKASRGEAAFYHA